jgi:excisionase family DNA binding protein
VSTGKLLRLEECAERTGHRVSTWRAWILDGKIPYYKVGGSVRVAERDLEELLKSARIPARVSQGQESRAQGIHA